MSIAIILILGYEFRSFLGLNEITINLDSSNLIKRNKIKIYKGWYKHSDTLIPSNKGKLIFDGKKFIPFETDYGENDFLIIYADTTYTKFRHFKTTNRMYDNYSFYFSKSKNNLILNVKIKGTDPMNFIKVLK